MSLNQFEAKKPEQREYCSTCTRNGDSSIKDSFGRHATPHQATQHRTTQHKSTDITHTDIYIQADFINKIFCFCLSFNMFIRSRFVSSSKFSQLYIFRISSNLQSQQQFSMFYFIAQSVVFFVVRIEFSLTSYCFDNWYSCYCCG